MNLDTNLSISPYFDDFNADSGYYQVLFKPSVAVQVRELNQLQTILQNQISQFGSNIFQDGSVISGCAFTFDQNYNYVKINDNFSNNYAIPNISNFVGKQILNNNGLVATIVNTIGGYQSQDPNLNTLYVKYQTTGLYPNGSPQSVFSNGDVLQIVSYVNTSLSMAITNPVTNSGGGFFVNGGIVVDTLSNANGIVTFANTSYVTLSNVSQNFSFVSGHTIQNGLGASATVANVYSATQASIGNVVVATVTNSTGKGYAFTTTSGVIFKKGFFLSVQPQTIIVSKYNNIPDGVSVGFQAPEYIITSNIDTSLVDNAAGSPNYSAPGADRLKIVPTLATKNANGALILNTDISNSTTFFSLCDFVGGLPVSIKNTPQYNALGAEEAQRTYDTNGDFVVNPFVLSTQTKTDVSGNSNTSALSIVSSPGSGYIKGYKVEFINNNLVDLYKGLDTETITNQNTTANYGNYFQVNQYWGNFNVRNVVQVELHSQAQNAITTKSWPPGYPTTKIGTAYLRGFAYVSGTPGIDAVYNLYVFNISMLPGYSVSQVKSVIYQTSSTIQAVADIVLTVTTAFPSGIATLYDTANELMIHPFGQKALVTSGFSGEQFVYRSSYSSSFSNNGAGGSQLSVTLPAANGTGTEQFLYTGNPLSTTAEGTFIVIPTSTGYSNNKTGTVTTNGSNIVVSGSVSTTFTSDYNVGDYIYISGSPYYITAIGNNTQLQVDSNISAHANVTHQKIFPVGVPINFTPSNRTMNVTSSSAAFVMGTDSVNASFNATVYFDVLRSSTRSIQKNIKKTSLVQINVGNNIGGSVGPWCLGLPDVLKLNNVWVGSGTYSNTNPDLTSQFILDNGQRDAFYNLAYIKSNTPLANNSTLLVSFDVFTFNESSGHGYFNAGSYPIDDANTSNTTAIQTIQIPQYVSTSIGSSIDLRDAIDFRPYANATANVVSYSTIADITTNPTTNLVISLPTSSGAYLPSPDSNYQATIQHYLYRTDRVVLTTGGDMKVIKGIPSNNPVPPLELPGTMTIGIANVAPYPTLSSSDGAKYNRYDYAVQMTMQQQKRFTMADIGSLANRIDNLEYYTSLSLLEQSAQSLQVTSSTTGQNRFKNGILVDPFRDFTICNTNDPQFNIALDTSVNQMRPAFTQRTIKFYYDPASSSNTSKTGRLVTLPYNISSTAYQSQPYSSQYRNCIEGNVYTYRGSITLIPNGTIEPDLTVGPTVISNLNLAPNFINIAQAYGTQWGNWVTSGSSTSNVTSTSLTGSITNPDGSISQSYQTQTATTTSTQLQQIGSQMTATPSITNVNLGNYVSNVSILPFVQPTVILFKAVGMKPSTTLYAFFNNTPVSNCCMPVTPYTGTVTITNGVPYDSFGNNIYYDINGNAYSYKSLNWGAALQADSTGTVYGLFSIPASTFQAGQIQFMLTDVSDLTTGQNSIGTQASSTYLATPLSIQSSTAQLQVQSDTINNQEVIQTQTIQQVSVASSNYVVSIPSPTTNPVATPDPTTGAEYLSNAGVG